MSPPGGSSSGMTSATVPPRRCGRSALRNPPRDREERREGRCHRVPVAPPLSCWQGVMARGTGAA
jgi:hypothetical protein